MQRLRAIATALGIRLQQCVQYPGIEKAVRSQRLRRLSWHLGRTMLTAACIQRVRSWGATTPRDATRPSSMSRTPGTLPELANSCETRRDGCDVHSASTGRTSPEGALALTGFIESNFGWRS